MVHMYYKRKWAGHLAAHVHHMRYWVALYVHKETRMAAVKRAEKSDLEDVFKKVNTTIGGRGGGRVQLRGVTCNHFFTWTWSMNFDHRISPRNTVMFKH